MNQGARKHMQGRATKKCAQPGLRFALSFIRTLGNCLRSTQPSASESHRNLLTLNLGGGQALAGSCGFRRHHRRWGITPRPENASPRLAPERNGF